VGMWSLMQMLDENKDDQESVVYGQDPDVFKFWIGPRGGNGIPAGTHGQPSFGALGKDTTHYSPCSPLLESNSRMDENSAISAVIHLFVPKIWAHPDPQQLKDYTVKENGEYVRYLGLFSFDKDEMDEHRAHLVDWSDPNTCWAWEKARLYYIKPLYNKKCPPPPMLHGTSKVKKPFCVNELLNTIGNPVESEGDKAPRNPCTIPSEKVVMEWLRESLLREERLDEDGQGVGADEDDENDVGEDEADEIDAGEETISNHLVNALDPEEFVRQLARIGLSSLLRLREDHVLMMSNSQY
jgi:hypothetical protein